MEAGGATGCLGLAQSQNAPNTNNPAASPEAAGGTLMKPRYLKKETIRFGEEESLGGLIIDKDCLINCNISRSSSSLLLSAFNPHTNFNVGQMMQDGDRDKDIKDRESEIARVDL